MRMVCVGRTLAWAGSLMVAGLGILRGCDCSDTPFTPDKSWDCVAQGGRPGAEDTACGTGKLFVRGECLPQRCDQGTPAAGCCPGMICTKGGECMVPPSRFTECTGDNECDSGQRCLERPLVRSTAKTCGFDRPDASGQCASPARLFNGRCVDGPTPPCGGGCTPGAVCNIDTNKCEEPPALTNPNNGCDKTCGEAQVLVYADPDSMLWGQCCEITCECETLPALQPGRWGRFSGMALGAEHLFVSAYDGTYGDLVLATHGRLSGQLATLEYVDGVPTSDPLVADPSGPRQGRSAPGPNVGEYTAIALQAGEPRIVYYDVDNADIKYAAFDSASGNWSISVLDDGREDGVLPGDVGRYSSLIIDDRGIAHVSYYVHRVGAPTEPVTGVRYARAKNTAPAGYDDWERTMAEAVTGCDPQGCLPWQACVLDSGVPTCATTRSDCSSACGCDETCVFAGGQPACRRALPTSLVESCPAGCQSGQVCVADSALGTTCRGPLDTCSPSCAASESCVADDQGNPVCRKTTPTSSVAGLPFGVGLFTSLGIYKTRPVVVYYDSYFGRLRGAVANFAADAASLTTFDDRALPVGCVTGSDVGQFASLAVAPDGNSLGVAFQSDNGTTLSYYFDAPLDAGGLFLTGTREVADDGIREGHIVQVGASASLAFGADANEAYIAYADQTENDLMLAYRRTDGWKQTAVLTEGAHGSFARLIVEGRWAWLSDYRREIDAQSRDISRLVVTMLDLDQLP